MASRGLPYGRGYLPDKIAQDQEWARRSRENPSEQNWVIDRCDMPQVAKLHGVTSSAANTLVLTPLPLYPYDTMLSEARIFVDTVGTGSRVDVGIYAYMGQPYRHFKLLGNTAVSLPTDSSSGYVVVESKEGRIYANNRYYMGSVVTHTTPASLTVADAGSSDVKFQTLPATTLPDLVKLSSLSPSISVTAPSVSYYNEEGSRVL